MKIEIRKNEENRIRRQFDEKSGKWLFSVVDAVGIFAKTSDPRNYWKVLKNRLKKEHFELVTKCNQLKMLAKDGKYYLTNVADAETILKIAELVPGSNIKEIEGCLCYFKDQESEDSSLPEAKLSLDGFQTDTEVFIRAMVAGIPPADISVRVEKNALILRGRREPPQNISEENYFSQELLWVEFYRAIALPCPVIKNNFEISETNGLITIRLKKII